jgi:hypothetical protein
MCSVSKIISPASPTKFEFDRKAMYRTGQAVPESGIYRITHSEHRLPHEVTLLKDQKFPRCCKCADLVLFEPVALAPTMVDRRGQIVLYELPCLEHESDQQSA